MGSKTNGRVEAGGAKRARSKDLQVPDKGKLIYQCDRCPGLSYCDACASQTGSVARGIYVRCRLLSGHFLPRDAGKSDDDGISPFACVEMHGVKSDSAVCETAPCDSGFEAYWDETFDFEVSQPDVAIITFQVMDSASKVCVAASAYRVSMLREGIRWVPLWDGKHHRIEHCGLLVEIRIAPSGGREGPAGWVCSSLKGLSGAVEMEMLKEGLRVPEEKHHVFDNPKIGRRRLSGTMLEAKRSVV